MKIKPSPISAKKSAPARVAKTLTKKSAAPTKESVILSPSRSAISKGSQPKSAAPTRKAKPKAKPSPIVKKISLKKIEAVGRKPSAKAESASTSAAKTKPKSTTKSVAKKVIKAVSRVFTKAEPDTEVTTETLVRRTFTRRKKIKIPAILLEGDAPAAPSASGPGEKFSLGPVPPEQKFPTAESELPEAYGTKKLFLTARDPHWLYAHWDLTRAQQLKMNNHSADGHLVLRIYAHKIEGHPTYEIHVHPESRHWFTHVERAGDSYVAELGYYSALGKWTRVSVSSGTMTPPDAISSETDTGFATIPFEFPFAKLLELIKAAVYENLPLAQALEELRKAGYPDLPRVTAFTAVPAPAKWTPQQEQALAKIINIDAVRRVWMGSLEITELIRRKLAHEVSSLGASQFGQDSTSSLTSPFGGNPSAAGQTKNFWFNVNAELIIYGATEPGAKVTLGGHEIKLRADGSFSYRFSLPDGKYDLPAVAVSAGGDDARAASLKFSRETEYLGDVGAHPQDPALQPPLPENL